MNRKFFTCLLMCFLFSTMLMGQTETKSHQNFHRHELSFGYGDVLLAISPNYGTYGVSDYPNYDWFDDNIYFGDEKSPGAFSLSYMYGLKKWLLLGVSTTYVPFYQNVYNFSHLKVSTNMGHRIAIIPMIRFSYVNKEYFSLYSACGIGVSLGIHHNSYTNALCLDSYPVIQLTGIGVSVGKQLRGFAELGCGPRGLFNCGVQYRF